MAGFKAMSLLAIAAASIATAQKHVTIPLQQHRATNIDPFAQTLHAVNKHLGQSKGFTVVPEMFDALRWYGTFTVGETQDLSLLIDTGSSDVAVSPNLYKPSSQSVNLHESAKLIYGLSAESTYKCDIYTDVVGMSGLQAINQTFGNLNTPFSPDILMPGFPTKSPHHGLIGFAGTKASDTQLGGTPFFQQLCNQEAVSECRFGLAFGTNGRGKHVLGGLDTSLFESLFEDDLLSLERQRDLFGSNVDHFSFNASVVYHTPSGRREEIEDVPILLDTGSWHTLAPLYHAQKIFTGLGIEISRQGGITQNGQMFVLNGYYACDSLAKVGFTIGAETFYFEPSAFKLKDYGNNNCTATIVGVSGLPFWLVGQDWHQGKYVDFQQTKRRFGVATLKDKEMDA